MPIDPRISLGVQPIQIDYQALSPVNQLAGVMKLKGMQQENVLNEAKLAEYQREVEGQNRLAADIAKNPELLKPENRASLLTGYGKYGQTVGGKLTETEKAMTEEAARRAKLHIDKAALYRDALVGVTDQRSALQWLQAQQRDPDMVGSPIASVSIMDAARSIPADPAGFAQWKQQAALGLSKYMELNKPQYFQQDFGGTKQITSVPGMGGTAAVVPGSSGTVTLTEAQKLQDQRDRERIKQEGQRLGLEGRRVAVLEENQRRDADPVFQQRMAGAKATGEAIAKGDVAAQQALPKIISRAEDGLRLIDELVGKQEVRDKNGKVIQAATKPHPGFENAVGTTWLPGSRFVPGTDAADFNSRFDQIKGASFLEAFEALKGGGAITEKEGSKGTDAINRMSLAQSEKEFMAAARDLQEVIRTGVSRAQSRASRPGGAAPAAGGAVDTNNPLLK